MFAIDLAREGFDKKACPRGCVTTPRRRLRLCNRFTQLRLAPVVPALDELPVAPLLDIENVTQALREFPADTAPGPPAFESNTCTMREAMGVELASLTSSLL